MTVINIDHPKVSDMYCLNKINSYEYNKGDNMRLHKDDISDIVDQLFEKLIAEKKSRKQQNLRSARKPNFSGYPDWFEGLWVDYPRRKDGNSKAKTYACCMRRIKEGYSENYLHEKTRVYAAHCESEGKIGTNFVLMGSTFFGSDLRFDDIWTIAKTNKSDNPEFKIPRNNEELWNFAKKYNYPSPGSRTFSEYRKLLDNEVEKRLKSK